MTILLASIGCAFLGTLNLYAAYDRRVRRYFAKQNIFWNREKNDRRKLAEAWILMCFLMTGIITLGISAILFTGWLSD